MTERRKCLYFITGVLLIAVAALVISWNAHPGAKENQGWAVREMAGIPELEEVAFTDGNLRAEEPMARGEAAVIMSGILGYETSSVNCFVDLTDDYYKDAVLKAVAAGLLQGDEWGKIRPAEPLTAEEDMNMLAKLLAPAFPAGEKPNLYELTGWKKDEAGRALTRGEFLHLLDACISACCSSPGEVKGKVFQNFVLVTANDVTFTDCKFKRPILLGPRVDERTIRFEDMERPKVEHLQDGDEINENAHFRYKIGGYETKFDPTMVNRSTNLRLSLEAIDGTTLGPGEEFSFNRSTGKKTYEKGYKDGIIVSGGKLTPGFAGGVCQVSTTAWNAAAESGMKIQERHAHSLEFSYVPPGRDATIYEGVHDLRFQNPYPVPVQIQTIYDEKDGKEGTITVGFYTQGYFKTPQIRIETTKEGNTYITKRFVDGVEDYCHRTQYSGFGF